MQNEEGLDFRSYLRREFTLRTRKNPRYSLRAFARDLKMAPSKVSEVLRGRGGISSAAAARAAKKLGFPDAEAQLFVALVELGSRSQVKRMEAHRMLESLRVSHGFNELDLERFSIISDWFHGAILELTQVKGFRSSSAWIAERLGISLTEAKEATSRLFKFGLLAADSAGNWRRSLENIAIAAGVPSRAIRAYHSHLLQMADAALEAVPTSERDFSAMTLAIDSTRIEQAREELRAFRRRFCNQLQAGAEKDRVYCLSMQFFPVDKMGGKTE